MVISVETINKWQDSLGNNEIAPVLEAMFQALKDTRWANELTLQSTRIKRNREHWRMSLIGYAEAQQEEGKVCAALLELLDELRKEVISTKQEFNTPSSPPNHQILEYTIIKGKFAAKTMNFYGKSKRKKS